MLLTSRLSSVDLHPGQESVHSPSNQTSRSLARGGRGNEPGCGLRDAVLGPEKEWGMSHSTPGCVAVCEGGQRKGVTRGAVVPGSYRGR